MFFASFWYETNRKLVLQLYINKICEVNRNELQTFGKKGPNLNQHV